MAKSVRLFTREDFAHMRHMKYTLQMRQCDIARHFNCSDATISKCLDLSYDEWYSQPADTPRITVHKLDAQKVIAMRAFRQMGMSYETIAGYYDVTADTARHAIIGNTWRHIPDYLPYTPPVRQINKAWRVTAADGFGTWTRIIYAPTVQAAYKAAYAMARAAGHEYLFSEFTGRRAPEHDKKKEITSDRSRDTGEIPAPAGHRFSGND